MGGDAERKGKAVHRKGFQSTPPHGGRPAPFPVQSHASRFQSTPPHGGRRGTSPRWWYAHEVSIHAPTWGATKINELCTKLESVSIHAPTWGATVVNHLLHFLKGVSIHAPTWGATIAVGVGSIPWNCFNPRPHMGGDDGNQRKKALSILFQSTPPHGGRPESAYLPALLQVSIHAPTWGATILP